MSMDLKDKKCKDCKKGTYIETSQLDDMDGVLRCSSCGNKINRYTTMKRAAEHHAVIAAIHEHTFTLPVPPSANRYWRVWNNRIVVTDEARAYKHELKYRLNNITPICGEVCVNFTVFRPAKRGDLDNFNKILLDSLQGIAYHNDNQIVEIHSFREDDKDNPRVELYIYERRDNGI